MRRDVGTLSICLHCGEPLITVLHSFDSDSMKSTADRDKFFEKLQSQIHASPYTCVLCPYCAELCTNTSYVDLVRSEEWYSLPLMIIRHLCFDKDLAPDVLPNYPIYLGADDSVEPVQGMISPMPSRWKLVAGIGPPNLRQFGKRYPTRLKREELVNLGAIRGKPYQCGFPVTSIPPEICHQHLYVSQQMYEYFTLSCRCHQTTSDAAGSQELRRKLDVLFEKYVPIYGHWNEIGNDLDEIVMTLKMECADLTY